MELIVQSSLTQSFTLIQYLVSNVHQKLAMRVSATLNPHRKASFMSLHLQNPFLFYTIGVPGVLL